jgi:PAS domain S-box-containing protein
VNVSHQEGTVQFTVVGGPAAEFVAATHDPSLVVLSVAISILGGWAATELAERIRDTRGVAWLPWLAGAAIVDGIGTWSMHYTAMLALRLPGGLYFDWRLVLLSYLVGAAGSAAALAVLRHDHGSRRRAIAAGVLVGGVGISGVHYSSMAAIVGPSVRHHYSPAMVVLSIAVAISIGTTAAFLLLRSLAATPGRRTFYTTVTWLVRGMANPAMHYTAMAGVAFSSRAVRLPERAVSIAAIGVIGISVVPLTVFVVALLTSFIDRLRKERAVLDKLFDQTPESVVVTREDGKVVRINREFTRLFGYSPQEAIGRQLDDLIAAAGDADAEHAPSAQGRTPIDGWRRPKDGRRIRVGGVRVQVPMPSGRTEQYTLMRDITEQTRAEQALRLFPRRLIETQEAEKQRIARELHDEVGQMLTGVGMLLGVTDAIPPEAQGRIAEARGVLRDLTERVRSMSLDLRPAMLEDFGLVRALHVLFPRYERQTGIRVLFDDGGLEGRRFRPEIEITAYRIVQEALTNVARHAQVQEASVQLSLGSGSLRVVVEDRGAGFDLRRPSTGTVGLAGMRERAAAVGGELTLAPAPGSGTRIVATLPLQPSGGAAAEPLELDPS